jgi:sensor histidine kinase YesM
MNKDQLPSRKITRKRIRGEQLLIVVIIALLVLFSVHIYTEAVMNHDEEPLTFFLTFCFLIGVYAGRSLAHLWFINTRLISRSLIIRLLVVILICIIWILFVAEISIRNRGIFLHILLLGLPFLLLSVGIGMAIKLMRHTIREKLYQANAFAEQSQSELRLLQTQLSPHFLFNTLNNMYGLSLTQHEKIPSLLLKLSSLLRYSVYDARELFVPLKNELAYINDYIDFEKIRIGDRLELQTTFEEPIDQNMAIAPLLLIVFIENAFKHAKNTTDQKIYIYITLKTWGNSILFSVKNSSNGVTDQQSIVNNHSGFGLDNVTKRLELLYKDKYDLQIQHEEGFYHVLLNLKVK